MQFMGLPLGTLGMVFGAVGALTALLYVLKLRRRPVPVPFSRLWVRILRDQESNQLFSRLRRLLSLLLQLALIALLVLALGDPRWSVSKDEGRSIVVLVDASASMKAHDVEPTRLDEAKRQLKKLVDGLGGSDHMLIAQMSGLLTPLSTMSSDLGELRAATERLSATDTVADLDRGLNFALDALRGRDHPEILIVSDGALGDVAEIGKRFDLSDVKVSFVPIGVGAHNVAITEFSVRRYPLDRSRYEVMIELTNTNDVPVEVELSLLGDGALVDVSHVLLQPNEVLPRFYGDLAGADKTLEAVIKPVAGERDQLLADNHAYALMPERQRVRVLLDTPGNTYLEAALLLDEYLEVTQIGPKDAVPDQPFDVAILDGVAPKLTPAVQAALYLDVPEEGGPVKLRKAIKNFGFDTWEKKSPLLRWMAIENIQVSKGHALEPGPGDKVVAASDLGPLLVSGKRDNRPFVALGFDPRNSDFVLRVAWPLFLMNAIHSFVEERSEYISSYRTGRVWRIPVPSDAKTVSLVGPDGAEHRLAAKDGHAAFFGEQAGFYELTVGSGPNAVKSQFAGNLSEPEESHIKPNAELALEKDPAPRPSGFDSRSRAEFWGYLLLLAALVSILEWVLYHRRVTV